MSTLIAAHRLNCAVQSYDWGKLGNASKVAQFAAIGTTPKGEFVASQEKPYAELWMGTHPNGPSYVVPTLSPSNPQKTPLKSVIDSDPVRYLGPDIARHYENDLPFLFKVLSVRKALSIQAHPDKALGKELFEKFPKIYKDPNHKPEMSIAITEFEVLCGFRPLNEMLLFLSTFPELARLVGPTVSKQFIETISPRVKSTLVEDLELNKAALRDLFTAVMTADPEVVKKEVKELVERLSKEQQPAPGTTEELVIRLNDQFPGDVGIFCVFLLNYIRLQPGQAIFLGANEPHAYLSGDCVECMAASDNVVRAGLTPKFKDVNVLVNMLTYRYGSAESQILKPKPYDPATSKYSVLYDPPIEEFSVVLTVLNGEGKGTEVFAPMSGPSILLITEGNAWIKVCKEEGEQEQGIVANDVLETGSVYFIGAGLKVEIGSEDGKTVCYRAFCAI